MCSHDNTKSILPNNEFIRRALDSFSDDSPQMLEKDKTEKASKHFNPIYFV
jgi:hypothetical protein